VEINALENEADRVSREAISRLFDEEKDPIQLIKWKEIYETLERATDKCEDAAAIFMAAFLNFAGAMVSTKVAATISKGIVDNDNVTQMVVLAGVIGATIWDGTTAFPRRHPTP